jgi:hypothetical protein
MDGEKLDEVCDEYMSERKNGFIIFRCVSADKVIK